MCTKDYLYILYDKGDYILVILIGGASHTGKTLIAQKLLERYKFPYLSLDHLKMGLIRGRDNCSFTVNDSDELIAEELWPIVKGIIMTVIENQQNLIIEGACLLPQNILELHSYYLKDIIYFYIIFSDKYIKENFESEIIAHRCEIENRKYNEDRTIEQFILEHKNLKSLCKINKATYFEINSNYESEIEQIYSWLDNRVRKLI